MTSSDIPYVSPDATGDTAPVDDLDRVSAPVDDLDRVSAPVNEIDRVLALVDEVIGLKAELAAQRYRHDLALWALAEQAAALEARTAHAEQHLQEVLASGSWRLGQAFVRPVELARR